MNDNQGHYTLHGKSPVHQLIISMVIIVFVGTILMTLISLAGVLMFGLDIKSMSGSFLIESGEKNIGFLRYIIITQDISLFIIPAIIILNLLKPDSPFSLSDLGTLRMSETGLIVILALCIFPVTGAAGLLNSQLYLPDWLSGLEEWMKGKEADAGNMINLLMRADTFGVMILNVIMIGVLPAFSEELIFRGVIQKILYRFFKPGYPAIWITAFLFSTLHFQFYGFIPRFILGLLYGYLFFWSRNLWLPVLAHFLNNALPVIGSYIAGWEKYNSGTDPVLWKQLIILPIPIFIGALILIYFRNEGKHVPDPVISQSEITIN